MPNHITNRLKINGTEEEIKRVFEKYNTHIKAQPNTAWDGSIICVNKSDDSFSVGWLDLKTGKFKTREDNSERIGLPDNWEIEISQARDYFPDFDKIKPHPRCDEYNGIPTQAAVSDHPNNWYNWNRENWGTKWNSYSNEVEKFGTYIFQTAWSGVPSLMLEISAQNLGIGFEYTYVGEDSGYNVAKFVFKDGGVVYEYYPEGGSKEAYDIYFELNQSKIKYYKLVDGNYEYIDEE